MTSIESKLLLDSDMRVIVDLLQRCDCGAEDGFHWDDCALSTSLVVSDD